ncbi:MAG: phosphopantetheine-binding protein, partial [Acidobacteriota bacterium]
LRVEYAPPRNHTEEAIALLWIELLGVERVGVHDNFLELGGDSLLASRLVTRMRQTFRVDLPIRLLFEASTVGELAEALQEKQKEEEEKQLQTLLERVKQMSEEELDQEISRRQPAASH